VLATPDINGGRLKMLKAKYTVEIGVEGTSQMRALANELGHPAAFKATKDELVRHVCCYDGLLRRLKVSSLDVTSVETRDGFQISVSAFVEDPEALSEAAVSRYVETWPATRAPDRWVPNSAAEALFTLATNLTPAVDSDFSDCFWIGSPIFFEDEITITTDGPNFSS
jgi:hypothetical protein